MKISSNLRVIEAVRLINVDLLEAVSVSEYTVVLFSEVGIVRYSVIWKVQL